MDEIRIENLEVYAYHGVYEKEKEKGPMRLGPFPFSLRGILRRVEHVSKKGAVPYLLNTSILYRTVQISC